MKVHITNDTVSTLYTKVDRIFIYTGQRTCNLISQMFAFYLIPTKDSLTKVKTKYVKAYKVFTNIHKKWLTFVL